MRTPYNVEYLYKGMIRRADEWKLALAAAILLGGQLAFALWLFLR